nr:YbjQ family protein [uncultured Mucilaginibacter sp.]
MKKVIVTTTETLQGWDITEYLKPIYSNLVVGANFFSDFGASFTDVFGGRATRYEKNIQMLNEKAVDALKTKALALGANCILGLKVDVDEVSGKNMQMFMITAWGTAVVAKNATKPLGNSSSKEIDKEKVNEQANIIRLLKASASPDFKLRLSDLEIIVDSKSDQFKDVLFNKYVNINPANFSEEELKQVFKLYNDYFAVLDPAILMPLVYNALLAENKDLAIHKLMELIKLNDLVDYRLVGQMLKADLSKQKLALKILLNDMPSYSIDDIEALEKIIVEVDDAFPILSTNTMKKGFLSSTEKPVWVCKCGGANNMDIAYCDSCAKDQYGFRNEELKAQEVIALLQNKLAALRDLLI